MNLKQINGLASSGSELRPVTNGDESIYELLEQGSIKKGREYTFVLDKENSITGIFIEYFKTVSGGLIIQIVLPSDVEVSFSVDVDKYVEVLEKVDYETYLISLEKLEEILRSHFLKEGKELEYFELDCEDDTAILGFKNLKGGA